MPPGFRAGGVIPYVAVMNSLVLPLALDELRHELAARNRKLGSQATVEQLFCWALVGVREWRGSVVEHRDMWINLTLLRF